MSVAEMTVFLRPLTVIIAHLAAIILQTESLHLLFRKVASLLTGRTTRIVYGLITQPIIFMHLSNHTQGLITAGREMQVLICRKVSLNQPIAGVRVARAEVINGCARSPDLCLQGSVPRYPTSQSNTRLPPNIASSRIQCSLCSPKRGEHVTLMTCTPLKKSKFSSATNNKQYQQYAELGVFTSSSSINY